MGKVYSCRVFAVFTALALCKYSWAEWNVTREPTNKNVSCGPHGNGSDCTDMMARDSLATIIQVMTEVRNFTVILMDTQKNGRHQKYCTFYGVGRHFGHSHDMAETAKWTRHFTKCPKDYRHYCINGRCRFVKEQNTPSCICPKGYMGSRCEYIDFDSRIGDQRQIIIACVIAALVFLIFLIVFICICVHRRKMCRRKKRKVDKVEEMEKLNMMSTTIQTRESISANAETSETNSV